jgi:hypothetical protein
MLLKSHICTALEYIYNTYNTSTIYTYTSGIHIYEYLDMMFLFKVSCGAINFPNSVLPTQNLNVRTTRSVQPNCPQIRTKKCYTATYQQSYTIRSTRIWNTLPKLITNRSNSYIPLKNIYLTTTSLLYNL